MTDPDQMTDLTDRMRTCAAFLATIEISEVLTDDKMEAIIDARSLLIEAADLLEREPVEPSSEAFHSFVEPTKTAQLPVVEKLLGEWVAPGGPLPYQKAVEIANLEIAKLDVAKARSNARACPRCDSRATKKVKARGSDVTLVCPVCATEWEYKP